MRAQRPQQNSRTILDGRTSARQHLLILRQVVLPSVLLGVLLGNGALAQSMPSMPGMSSAPGNTPAGSTPPAGVSPDEHAAHHPDQQPAKGGAAPKTPAAGKPGAGEMTGSGGMSGSGGTGGMSGGMGSMMGDMGKMMEGMHRPPRKELYPSLMELSDLPAERRAEIARQARERITAATQRMSAALTRLQTARPEDGTARQQASSELRGALAQYESGLAAERALQGGASPRDVALQWFRREMNLVPSGGGTAAHGPLGVPMGAFHLTALLILASFAGAMLWIYLQRMRRASELLGSLAAAAPASPSPAGAVSASALAPRPSRAAPTPTGSWAGALRVARIFEETADVKTFRLAGAEGGDLLPFTFEPGQFLTATVNVDGKEVKRSYSIASSPCCQGWCELTVKHAPGGLVSGYLHEQVREGDLLPVAGPYGRFTFRGKEAPDVVFIAGGVGITPLMSSIRYLTDQSWPGEIFLIYACARLEDVIFREELEYLRHRHPKLHVTLVLSKEESPAWTGPRGYVTQELLRSAVPDLSQRRVHLCGPPPMMEAVKAALAAAGVPAEQIQTELFLSPDPHRIPAPGGEITTSGPGAVAAVCTFARSRKEVRLTPDQTVLEGAEAVGVPIDYSCRQGYCGVCKVRLLSGQVTMEVTDGLTPAEQAGSVILACQAKATADLAVDA